MQKTNYQEQTDRAEVIAHLKTFIYYIFYNVSIKILNVILARKISARNASPVFDKKNLKKKNFD